MRQEKQTAFVLGVIGLAGALTMAAFAAPPRTGPMRVAGVPADANEVVARVTPRSGDELALRSAVADAPNDLEAATQLARAEIEMARREEDPRHLGRAQAILRPWWHLSDPPADVLFLRAVIAQSLHDFPTARADLERYLAQRPDDEQALLTLAVVATVTGDYQAATASCERIRTPFLFEGCSAPVRAVGGAADDAYHRLGPVVERRRTATALWRWGETILAELAMMRGDVAAAERHAQAVVTRDPTDGYARALLADILLDAGRAAEASALLKAFEERDSALVRRAIAEHRTNGPDATRLRAEMRARIAAAAARGDRLHLREEARFALDVEGDVRAAAKLARENWEVQKELADARLLLRAAVAAADLPKAQPVVAWAQKTGVRDTQLTQALSQLPSPGQALGGVPARSAGDLP